MNSTKLLMAVFATASSSLPMKALAQRPMPTDARQVQQMQNLGRAGTRAVFAAGAAVAADPVCPGAYAGPCAKATDPYTNRAADAFYNTQQRYMGPNAPATQALQRFGQGLASTARSVGRPAPYSAPHR